ncbi:MAG: pilus assembly protein PilZ [Gammaproteobacteria bacterium]|nr:pilus assembly protein PilZ [Gammaproteobacteria bacterium]
MKVITLRNRGRQRGAILITALMILLLMTLFGLSTMDTNILEEKMAGNMRDRNVAFQAAESALRAAERWLLAQTVLPNISATGNIRDVNAIDPDTEADKAWWVEADGAWWKNPANNAKAHTGDAMLPDVAEQPAYIIEKLPPRADSLEAGQALDDADTYLQVTARGVGGSETTVVILQSVYKW